MRLLIVGYGSIGARHGRLAQSLGMDVECVTRNAACPFTRHPSITDALSSFSPDRVIISNPTSMHAGSLTELVFARYDGAVLIEKPVFSDHDEAISVGTMRVFVAYNLRFHPLVAQIRAHCAGLTFTSAIFHAGQYLPDWRPNTDYRQTYSSSKKMGGGVLRDLSHEIDLALWLCGRAVCVAAIGGHFSELEIDSDDVFSTLSVNSRCPAVSLTVNYLDRSPRRHISLNAPGMTVSADLIAGTLAVNKSMSTTSIDRDATYLSQLVAFRDEDTSTLASYVEAVDVTRFIAAAEEAASRSLWVSI